MIVSVEGRIYVVDLTCPDDYQIIQEVSTADNLYAPQKYVMSGVNPRQITNTSSNYYVYRDDWHKKDSMYRTFCELDLAEVERVAQYKTALSVVGMKFDVNALFANFSGNSLFSIFEERGYLLLAILKFIDTKQYDDE